MKINQFLLKKYFINAFWIGQFLHLFLVVQTTNPLCYLMINSFMEKLMLFVTFSHLFLAVKYKVKMNLMSRLAVSIGFKLAEFRSTFTLFQMHTGVQDIIWPHNCQF